MVTGSPGWWNIIEAAGGWDGIVLANAQNKDHAHFEGKNLAQIAREWKKTPADAAFDLVAAGQGRVTAIYHMMSEQDVITALKFPWTSIGSDAGASVNPTALDTLGLGHPRGYGNFPRLIARYVREKRVLSLEQAIRKMTSWPATRMRLNARGVIKEGAWADVVIFDYDTIQDRATYEKPFVYPVGIDYVLVNGQVVIDHGKHTGARPGHVIYGPGRTTSNGATGEGQ
jgi:N-acyl-D-aspartate/D-glutamate deacylase